MKKLSISIVLYSSDFILLDRVIAALTKACSLASSHLQLNCCLDLVNNNPKEKNLKLLEDLVRSHASDQISMRLLRSNKNGGYGAGNNLSIARNANSDFHLVLNPDVILEEGAIVRAINFLEVSPDVGLVVPKVMGEDGKLHRLCKRNPTLLDMFLRAVRSNFLDSIFSKQKYFYEMADQDYEKLIKPVPYPTGCFMFFRGSTLRSIDGFDEGFFLHYEDADIGRRISRISQVAYVPQVVVVHVWARETHKNWKMRWITIMSGLRYWYKWGGIW